MKKTSCPSNYDNVLLNNISCQQRSNLGPNSLLAHNIDQMDKKCGNGISKNTRLQFPSKLRTILEDAEKENFEDIIAWLPDGLGFEVFKTQEFGKKIMPRYFTHTNYRSFQRSLYHYQFSKVRNGQATNAYAHPHFNRKDKHQCPKFVRKNKAKPHGTQRMLPTLSQSLMIPPCYRSRTGSYNSESNGKIHDSQLPLPTNRIITSDDDFSKQRIESRSSIWDDSPDDAFFTLTNDLNQASMSDVKSATNADPAVVSLETFQDIETVLTSRSAYGDGGMKLVSATHENKSFIDRFAFPLSDDLEPTPLLVKREEECILLKSYAYSQISQSM